MSFEHHDALLRRCLDLAERGRGLVGNGALVGAILVRDGAVLAEGWHCGYGNPHAERDLLQKFDQKISSEDILYVNLEPCCHTGKTPPCTEAIVAAGIRRVVVGMVDPDPRVAGAGIQRLRAQGVDVRGPVSSLLCERFNRGFVAARRLGRPWVTLKQAIARDGAIANPDGSPRRITSDTQNQWSHAWLRARHDAILVGVDTVRSDDPLLNNRSVQIFSLQENNIIEQKNRTSTKIDHVQPLRIILDPTLRCPRGARVLTDDRPDRTMLVVDAARVSDGDTAVQELRSRGIAVECLPFAEGGFAWAPLWDALLSHRGGAGGITSVLVEGGGATWRRFRDAGVVDEEVLLTGLS